MAAKKEKATTTKTVDVASKKLKAAKTEQPTSTAKEGEPVKASRPLPQKELAKKPKEPKEPKEPKVKIENDRIRRILRLAKTALKLKPEVMTSIEMVATKFVAKEITEDEAVTTINEIVQKVA
jgi:hypothetical protein